MSIASEFDSTIENIKSDYEGLENIGADLTNIDKNIYNIRTCLDNIYTNLPKTTGEGTNLSLNTLKGRINVDDILGDTQQDTTNGYQLLDLTLAKLKTFNTSGTWSNNVYTISGATITINDDMSIKVNGATTAQVTLMLNGGAIPYPTGTYYLSGASNGSNTTYDIRIFNYDGTSAVAQCFTGTKQVAVVNNSQSFNMAVVIRSGVTCNNTMFYPMLSTTNTSDYEPYTNGASPNPTYPQDISVVTGTQEVVVQNANILDTSEIKVVKNQSGDDRNGYYCKINTTGTYTLLLNTTNTMYFGKSTNLESATTLIGSTSATYTTNYTFNEGEYFVIWGTKTDTDKLMVALGTSLPYIEHQEQTKTLHLGDIELGGIGTYKNRIFETSGKNLTDIVLNGSTTGEITYKTYTLQPNTQYTISTNTWVTSTSTANVFASSGTSFSPSSSSNGVNGSRTITSDNNGNITIGYRNVNMSMDYSSGKYWVMLNEGSTALPYEPYGSDKWYIEKNNIEKDKEYLATQVGQVDTITDYARIRVYLNNACISTPTGLCSHLKFEASYSGQSNHFYAQGNYAYLIIDKTLLSTIDVTGAKAYLNTLTGLKILYPLATPTYTEITNTTLLNELNELEKMMSYNGQTNISISGNLPMLLSVSALKGE